MKEIDHLINLLRNGSLTLIAARPHMGKTCLTLDIVEAFTACTGKVPVYFSLEAGKEQIAVRLLQKKGMLTYQQLYTVEAKEYAKQLCVDYLKESPIKIYDDPYITVEQMKEICKNTMTLGLIVVDYLQLVCRKDGTLSTDISALSEISLELKTLAKELNVPVICTAHLPRSVDFRKDKHPILRDLCSQGAIVNDSDLIIFLYRDSRYDPESPFGMTTECIVAKNRYGDLSTMLLAFDSNRYAFLTSKNN